MSNGDGAFWKLAKEIGGLEADRAQSAPCAEVLAEHFAEKMTSGKGVEDRGFTPKNPFKIKFTSFKVRFKKVLKTLKSIDPNKSANGVAPRFWKECAVEIAPSTCKMFKYIVQKATYRCLKVESGTCLCSSQARISKARKKLQTFASARKHLGVP